MEPNDPLFNKLTPEQIKVVEEVLFLILKSPEIAEPNRVLFENFMNSNNFISIEEALDITAWLTTFYLADYDHSTLNQVPESQLIEGVIQAIRSSTLVARTARPIIEDYNGMQYVNLAEQIGMDPQIAEQKQIHTHTESMTPAINAAEGFSPAFYSFKAGTEIIRFPNFLKSTLAGHLKSTITDLHNTSIKQSNAQGNTGDLSIQRPSPSILGIAKDNYPELPLAA